MNLITFRQPPSERLMALDLVEDDDIINNAPHDKLDKQLWEIFGHDASPPDRLLVHFLMRMVDDRDYLNKPLYSTYAHAAALFKTEPGLGQRIRDLWKTGFKEIRSLKILQRPQRVPVSRYTKYEQAVVDAFSTEYQGSSAVLLGSVIDDTYGADGATGYIRALSITQSSGMGKSRTMDEVAKSRVTFPICIREEPLSEFEFEIREYFTQHGGREPGNEGAFQDHVLRFLAALFDEASRVVRVWTDGNPTTYLATAEYMHSYFSDLGRRRAFYHNVVANARRSRITGEAQAEQAASTLLDLVPDRDSVICPIIVSLDEVQTLYTAITEEKSCFDVLCSALASVKSSPFFVVFLSTASRLPKLTAIAQSYRPNNNKAVLPAPFTELGFDVFAKDTTVEDELDLNSVKDFSYLAGFGRPMWAALWKALQTPYEPVAGPRRIILEAAMEKLSGQERVRKVLEFQPSLSVLSTRLLLDIDSAREGARMASEALVADHMRIAFSVPENQKFMRTGAPSEPILAEAAARLMNTKTDYGSLVINVLWALQEYFRDGFAPSGPRGEFIGRTLDILAIDSAINAMGSSNYSTPVLVTDYLKQLLGADNYETIKHTLPSNQRHVKLEWQQMTLEKAFANAYTRSTHYVKAENSSVIKDEYLWGYWARGVALQLNQCQEDSYRAIPIHWTSFQATGVKPSPPSTGDQGTLAEGKAEEGKKVQSKKAKQRSRRKAGRGGHAKQGGETQSGDGRATDADKGTGSGAGGVEELHQGATIQKLGRDNCSAIIHQDRSVATVRAAAIPIQQLQEDMFASAQPKPVLVITHIYDWSEAPSVEPSPLFQSTHEGPANQQAPTYEITIRGLHEDNYGPVLDSNREAFQALLGSDSMYTEHTRQSRAAINALRQLNPGVSESRASRTWVARGGT